MRIKPETLLITVMAVFALTGVVAMAFAEMESDVDAPYVVDPALIEPGVDPAVTIEPLHVEGPSSVSPSYAAREWFASVRAHCNPVEVETHLRWYPAPETEDGAMREAACLALAGQLDRARSEILSLPADRRYEAAGIVFAAGHPAADAGDELAAGPLMELVVEFWPNHYMALYHAGAAAYERGEYERADEYLLAFLEEYQVEDGWRRNAEAMIGPHGC